MKPAELSPVLNEQSSREAPVPEWLRAAVQDVQGFAAKDVAEVALAAGAALGALDAVVRRQERWAGTWRQRLALAAAAVATRQAGRVEDEAALRDAILLTRPGDDAGPGGRIALAWRRLAVSPASKLFEIESLTALLDDCGLAHDVHAVSGLRGDLRGLPASGGPLDTAGRAFAAAERGGFGPAVGAWLADGLLAQRLGWSHAVPLLGTEAVSGRPRRRGADRDEAAAFDGTEADGVKRLLAAQARAALRAIDLSAGLGRRADRLLAVAPKLRARGADAVVGRLMSDDAMVASQTMGGMSERGLRRLFDRLVNAGAVRELSGRATFRIYGL